jgi:hypothetical protein
MTGLHARGSVQHLPCSYAVDHDSLRVGRFDASRHDDTVACLDHRMTGPAAGLRQYRDPLAGQRRIHLRADLKDGADEVVSRHEGEVRLPEVTAAAHCLLGVRDARCLDGNEEPPRSWGV